MIMYAYIYICIYNHDSDFHAYYRFIVQFADATGQYLVCTCVSLCFYIMCYTNDLGQ